MASSPDPERLRLLVTAGPTHEPIDAVRYIGNRSSGRMGIAIAEAGARRGHAVTLLLGPSPLRPQSGLAIALRRFETAADLEALLAEEWPSHDVVVMAAAVADFRAAGLVAGKIERGGPIALRLEPTPDLLAGLAASARPGQILVGFALEPSERLAAAARAKLERKGVHAIVANALETMEADRVTAELHLRGGSAVAAPPDLDKAEFAEWLLDRLPEIGASDAARARRGP
jgi:phosphopantothenoylcysteine decarboxylase/phosphopantothenate--cysteine ligase